jgi:hypothetical protein
MNLGTLKLGQPKKRPSASWQKEPRSNVARVTFHVEGDEKNIRNASLPTPSTGSELWAWWKAARLALPTIPDPDDGEWFISHAFATIAVVIYELHNDNGEKGLVIIDRRAPAIGIN